MMTYLECLCKNKRPTDRPTKYLFLGFYNRDNTGDELYKIAFKRIFRKEKLLFECMDDVERVPDDVGTIVCGGGDIINSYFMDKFVRVLRASPGFCGRIYAVSVGIPYDEDVRYLGLFDHVFVRSSADHDLAKRAIGAKNVSLVLDAVQTIPRGYYSQLIQQSQQGSTNVGVYPATPIKATFPMFPEKLARALVGGFGGISTVRVHIVPFNLYEKNPTECDTAVCIELEKELEKLASNNMEVIRHAPESAKQCASILRSMDMNVCMRYHAAVISSASVGRAKTVIFSDEPKMHKFAYDTGCPILSPTPTAVRRLSSLMSKSISEAHVNVREPPKRPIAYEPDVVDVILRKTKIRSALVRPIGYVKPPVDSYRSAVRLLQGILESKGLCRSTIYDRGVCRGVDPGLVCYLLTGDVGSPHAYGLTQNMTRHDFVLDEAMRCIWHDAKESRNFLSAFAANETYYPNFANEIVDRKSAGAIVIDFDAGLLEAMRNYHRSGWPYAVSGLMPLHKSINIRASPSVYVDLYVDRTFHWGSEAYAAVERIPYRKPWIGVVHHTFESSTSPHNCTNLFKKPEFLESLAVCSGIVSLSKYMGVKLREALDRCGHRSVPVHVVYHPTETPAVTFKVSLFLSNEHRRVVQIGSWLRNRTSIGLLDLKGNVLALERSVLDYQLDQCEMMMTNVCGFSVPEAPTMNKYIKSPMKDVKHIKRLSNTAYDAMLTNNVVFLDLVDCSAVNTVIECLVRCTPIVVNRHPALEEVLRADYPGFYGTLEEASAILNSIEAIENCHSHLVRLDKTNFKLVTFVSKFIGIILQS